MDEPDEKQQATMLGVIRADGDEFVASFLEAFEGLETEAEVTVTAPNGQSFVFVVRGARNYEELIQMREKAAQFAMMAKARMSGPMGEFTPMPVEAAAQYHGIHACIVSPKIHLHQLIKLSGKVPMLIGTLEQAINRIGSIDATYHTRQRIETEKNV